LITNVGLAHVQNFSSADEVARAKSEVLEGVAPGGAFVANADDARVMAMARSFSGRVVTFGDAASADLRASAIRSLGAAGTAFTVTCGGASGEARLTIPGTHHVKNVLAALATALALGFDPLGLLPRVAELVAGEHRGSLLRLGGDVLVLDDCYNSSPAALFHALETLATLPGARRVAIVGDMLELGSFAEASHREAGRRAARAAGVVLGVGPDSAALVEEAHAAGCRAVQHVPDAATAAVVATALVHDGDAVLVKGSRGIGLDVVVEALRKARA
jgi:UDP-N-acetylmuramyl pentapeptide synthase